MNDTRRWTTAGACGLVVVALGLLAGLSDAVPGAPLAWVFADPQPTTPWAVLGFVLSGLALALVPLPSRRAPLALLVLIWGLAIAGLAVPLSTLPPAALASGSGDATAGLMAPNTALGFLLHGLALAAFLALPEGHRRARLLAALGSLLVALSAIALFGQSAAIESPYRWGNLYHMAQFSALSFLLLGIGLGSLGWDDARRRGSQTIWLPMVVSGSLAIASLAAWQALTSQEMRQIRATILAEAELSRNEIASQIDDRTLAVSRMGSRWAIYGPPSRLAWVVDVQILIEHYPGLAALAWIDEDYRPRWHLPEGDASGRDESLGTAEQWRRILAGVRQDGRLRVGERVRLPSGGSGPLIAAPLQKADGFDGFLIASIDTTRLVEDSLSERRLPEGYGLAIRDGGRLVYRHGPDPEGIPPGYRQVVPLNLDKLHWTVELWPSRSRLDLMTHPLATLLLLAGLTLSGLLGLIVRLTQRAQSRAQEAEAANAAFAREVRVREGAEAALARQAEDLRRSNADLEQFAYVASHDLQEPLRMVASYLQLIERRYRDRLDDDGQEFMDYAVDGANRMRTLINDLLAYSRVGTRGTPFEVCDLNAVYDQAVANLGLAINESEAHVTKSQLPTVLGDRGQLTQLMQNLIGNAVKFRGTAAPSVRVEATQEAGEWVCVVHDNGIGLAPEYADRVFLIFQRLHSRAEYEGTGIGLAICKRIVERHGGRIWLTSEPGRGTSIWWTLPVAGEKCT